MYFVTVGYVEGRKTAFKTFECQGLKWEGPTLFLLDGKEDAEIIGLISLPNVLWVEVDKEEE